MSNTAVVTPVAASGSGGGLAAAVLGGCILGIAAAAVWLCKETEQDRKAVEEYREVKRRELLENPLRATDMKTAHEAWPELKAATLHISHPETLVQSAQSLGYRLEPLVDAQQPLRHQLHIFLQKPTGERLAISYDADRRIVLTTAGDDSRLHHLVRTHTVDRAMDHLHKKGLRVQTATLANGEVQILAREKTRRRDGMAEIKAQVRNDGTAWIDVDRLQSNRCQEIVREFAEAVGGQITDIKMKSLSFQLPGEPTKTKIEV